LLSQGSDVGSAATVKRRHRSAESSTRPLVVVVSASAVEAGLDGRVAAALQELGPPCRNSARMEPCGCSGAYRARGPFVVVAGRAVAGRPDAEVDQPDRSSGPAVLPAVKLADRVTVVAGDHRMRQAVGSETSGDAATRQSPKISASGRCGTAFATLPGIDNVSTATRRTSPASRLMGLAFASGRFCGSTARRYRAGTRLSGTSSGRNAVAAR
jgi:hypothetical protein